MAALVGNKLVEASVVHKSTVPEITCCGTIMYMLTVQKQVSLQIILYTAGKPYINTRKIANTNQDMPFKGSQVSAEKLMVGLSVCYLLLPW